MSLRCKPGDLAVIVSGPFVENIGRLVEVVSYEPGRYFAPGEPAWLVRFSGTLTVLRRNGVPVARSCDAIAYDKFLRPIRPGDGEDETLRWAGKPQETPADVIASEVSR